MGLSRHARPSPAIVLAALGLTLAVGGTAIAGPEAITRAVSKSKVKSIAKKQADKRITKKAPELSVANAAALGGEPASAFTTGPGRVVGAHAVLAAADPPGDTTVLTVDGLVSLVVNCDPGQMFWEFENLSGGPMHFSGVAENAANTYYEGQDVSDGNSFAFFGGNGGGYEATVQASSATGKVVTVTAFIDPQSAAGCPVSAQAVVTG